MERTEIKVCPAKCYWQTLYIMNVSLNAGPSWRGQGGGGLGPSWGSEAAEHIRNIVWHYLTLLEFFFNFIRHFRDSIAGVICDVINNIRSGTQAAMF